MTQNEKTLAGLGVVAIILLIVFGPFLTIWALNTLFPALAIEYTWKTWLSIILVTAAIRCKS